MDKVAKRIIKEQVTPLLEKMLDTKGIPMQELHIIGELVDIAKDLVEYDIMCFKLAATKKQEQPEQLDWEADYAMPDDPENM